MEKGKEVGPLVGVFLPAPLPPEVSSLKAEDIYRFEDLVEALAKVEDVYRTVILNPEVETANVLIEVSTTPSQGNKFDVDNFLWRVGLPLLPFMLIGIAVLTCFI